MMVPVVFALASGLLLAEPPAVFESLLVHRNFELSADPDAKQWKAAPRVLLTQDYLGKTIPGPPTEIRSRWSKTHLYLLFICPYKELHMKIDPKPAVETARLWNWDVVEAFIGSDVDHIAHYKELQMSPQGEWVDLDIDRDKPKEQGGMKWNSGYSVKGRIDSLTKVWYGEMRIPFVALDAKPPARGRELRTGLYRISGTGTARTYYAWQPTGQTSFHVPQAFGILRLR